MQGNQTRVCSHRHEELGRTSAASEPRNTHFKVSIPIDNPTGALNCRGNAGAVAGNWCDAKSFPRTPAFSIKRALSCSTGRDDRGIGIEGERVYSTKAGWRIELKGGRHENARQSSQRCGNRVSPTCAGSRGKEGRTTEERCAKATFCVRCDR